LYVHSFEDLMDIGPELSGQMQARGALWRRWGIDLFA
jgi:hypothetical protein